jgi:acetolactate synthase-1/2/3 large subunit
VLVADLFISHLRNIGLDRVFVYPGGTIAPLVNACLEANIKVEVFKSEQGAVYAALAVARVNGHPQVAMVTSGPGVTNAITPLADAFYDSTPLLLVTGQIGTADLFGPRIGVRQRGFQETPTVELVRPISKKAVCYRTPQDCSELTSDLIKLTISGRHGPVVIDFPMDVQRQEVSLSSDSLNLPPPPEPCLSRIDEVADPSSLKEIAECCSKSRRIVLLLGQGAIKGGDLDVFSLLADKLDASVVTSFMGVGAFSCSSPRSLGYVGHTGHLAANRAVFESDLVIVLGSRLDVRQTGTLTNQFAPNASVAWIDIDSMELSNPRVNVRWSIQADAASFARRLLLHFDQQLGERDQHWASDLRRLANERVEDRPNPDSGAIAPREVMDALAEAFSKDKGQVVRVVTGVGCHQHWTARHLPYEPQRVTLLTSGGHGAMGYDLPSAVGAAMARPSGRVLCVVGDGSALMNIQELGAIRDRDLDIKILVMNNNRLGIVSQFQLITWGTDPTTGFFSTPDFCAIAEAFGIPARRLSSKQEVPELIDWLWGQEGPALVETHIDPLADVTPMLLAGKAMNEMWMGRQDA